MSIENKTLAIVGATGAVGRESITVMEQRKLKPGKLKLLASARSAGETISAFNHDTVVEELTEESFRDVDIALFCAGSSVSKKFADAAVEAGTVVIDKTSAFRMNEGVPLVVPEVNSEALFEGLKNREDGKGLIVSNPNCSTIPLTVILKPLNEAFGLKRVVVSTYQSVSGAGREGMDELWEQTKGLYSQQEVKPETFQHRIAFNCIPHIDSFQDDGYTKEEIKLIEESRKILDLPDLAITCTAVRVPVMACHAESVNLEFLNPASPEQVREVLEGSDGVVVQDNPGENTYPMNSTLIGTDETYVGRIRADKTVKHGLNLWLVADNLRKGAALNGVQIAELVLNGEA